MFTTIIEKIINKILLILLCKKIDTCLFGKNLKKEIEIKRILFYFPDEKYMHLGDHLFFEPTMKNLVKMGYEVSVCPTQMMWLYFEELGYKLIKKTDVTGTFDLMVTRTDYYEILLKHDNMLLYDYINIGLKEKICNDIMKKIFLYLGLEYSDSYDDIPSNIIPKKKITFNLDKKEKYILFNNYLDSGKKWNSPEDYNEKFAKKISELKKEGYKIIHLGTEIDKKNDTYLYKYVDLDLRGKTTIEELFSLVSLDNVEKNIGFDAFIMHLFFMNKKDNYIYLRNKVTKKREKVTKLYFNPPSKGIISKIEYL